MNSGEFLSLWYDKWCLGTSLRSHFIGPISEEWDQMKVANIISPVGRFWDLKVIYGVFSKLSS